MTDLPGFAAAERRYLDEPDDAHIRRVVELNVMRLFAEWDREQEARHERRDAESTPAPIGDGAGQGG